MTRFWSVSPEKLCDQHLLGLHKEIHQEIGSLKAGNIETVIGHIKENQVEFKDIVEYHKSVEDELLNRGFNPDSPINEDMKKLLKMLDDWGYTIYEFDKHDLINRCDKCKLEE